MSNGTGFTGEHILDLRNSSVSVLGYRVENRDAYKTNSNRFRRCTAGGRWLCTRGGRIKCIRRAEYCRLGFLIFFFFFFIFRRPKTKRVNFESTRHQTRNDRKALFYSSVRVGAGTHSLAAQSDLRKRVY